MIRPKKQTQDSLRSFTKFCELLIKQTHTKLQETLEFRLSKSRETFSFKLSFYHDPNFNWMIRLTSLEVYKSIFNITEENNKFELYTDTFDNCFWRIKGWTWGNAVYFRFYTISFTTWIKKTTFYSN